MTRWDAVDSLTVRRRSLMMMRTTGVERTPMADLDLGALIQGAAFTALSPWCDPDDERVGDAMADQVRDAVLTALADDGLLIVRTGCVHDFDPECARCNTLRPFRVDLTS